MTPTPKKYLTNENLIAQITISKAQDAPTKELIKMLMLLAEKVSVHRYFRGYSYREDLPSIGILALLESWNKFDLEYVPSNGQINPFSYYTTVLMRAYQGFCYKEHHQSKIKDELIMEAGFNPSWNAQEPKGERGRLSHDDSFMHVGDVG